jgi:integrase
MRVTDTWLRAAKPRKGRYDVTTELRGLMVRVHPSGSISFRYRYKRGKGKDGRPIQYVIVLGEYGKTGAGISLEDAHDFQHKAKRWLTLGLDPVEEKAKEDAAREKARQVRAEAGTVADLVDEFTHRKLRDERWDEKTAQWIRDPKVTTRPRKRPEAAEWLLKANLVGSKLDGQKVGRMRARDLTRRHMVRLLDGIVDRGAPVLANRTHAIVKQLFDWAAAEELISTSPMAGIERPGGKEVPRERVLTAEEIRKFWTKLNDAVMVEPTRLALKLLLVTAQRRGEITFAKWSHFELERTRLDKTKGASVPDPVWTVPVELLKTSHAKKKKRPEPHVVPLSPLAIEILAKLRVLTGESVCLLPARASAKSDAPYSEAVLSRAVRANKDHFGIEHFTPHDLRRTAASHMTRLGVPRLHVEKVLNHTTGDVAEIYERHDYLDEKKQALRRWADELKSIVERKEPVAVSLVRAAGQ